MAGTNYETVLGAETLCGLIQDIAEGLPKRLPEALYNPTDTVEGDTGKYDKVSGNRDYARLVRYGSPSQRANMKGIKEVPVKLIHTFEHQIHKPLVYKNLRAEGDEGKQERGKQTIARHVRDFASRLQLTRQIAIQQALLKGIIYIGTDGKILPSSSGSEYSIDFQVPAGNKDQLNVFGSGDLLTVNWTSATADVITEMNNVKSAALKKTGYPLANVVYGKNILYYLLNNNFTKELINRNVGFQAAAAGGKVPQGMFDLNWYPGQDLFYVDANGDIQTLVGDNQIILFPEVDETWWGLLEGTFDVPTSVDIRGDAAEAMDDLAEVQGMFSYAILTPDMDPPAIKHFHGDTFLPVLKVPEAVFQGTVKTT